MTICRQVGVGTGKKVVGSERLEWKCTVPGTTKHIPMTHPYYYLWPRHRPFKETDHAYLALLRNMWWLTFPSVKRPRFSTIIIYIMSTIFFSTSLFHLSPCARTWEQKENTLINALIYLNDVFGHTIGDVHYKDPAMTRNKPVVVGALHLFYCND